MRNIQNLQVPPGIADSTSCHEAYIDKINSHVAQLVVMFSTMINTYIFKTHTMYTLTIRKAYKMSLPILVYYGSVS